jgi:hypothetical protein
VRQKAAGWQAPFGRVQSAQIAHSFFADNVLSINARFLVAP